MMTDEPAFSVFARIEAAIRKDPAGRGLLGPPAPELGLGEVEAAARSLAKGRRVVIVTGFFVPTADPPAAETDGPPGAVALAQTLRRLGSAATVVTDLFCGTAVAAAAEAGGLEAAAVLTLDSATSLDRFLRAARPDASHLIAIERVGPCYGGSEVRDRWGADAETRFLATLSPSQWSQSLNMHGRPIDDWTVDFSNCFESPPRGVTTIGLGDGGNELGLGKFAWPDLSARLGQRAGIACRVAADHAVIAGTSNWAAYGLAAATAAAAGRPEAFVDVTASAQAAVIDAMVRQGPAVDGVTGRPEISVDGLPLPACLGPIDELRVVLGLA